MNILHAIVCASAVLLCAGCQQVAAVNRLEAKGATISPDWTSVEFHNDHLSDDDVRSLSSALRTISPDYVGLNQTAISDSGLAHLAEVESLRTISVTGTSVTPEGVEAFLRSAPPAVELVVLPDHWDKDPALASQLKELISRYPQIKFLLGSRDGAAVESRLPQFASDPEGGGE